MGDTQGYLTLSAIRPPVYGWCLVAYQYLTGGLAGLTLAQLVAVSAGLLVFAIELGALTRSLLVGPLSVVLIMLHPVVHDSVRTVESESVYTMGLLGGLGLLFRAARTRSLASALGASFCFALCTATRTTGTAFLPLVPLVLLFDKRLPWRAAAERALASLAVMGLVIIVAMAGNWLKNDRFEIGSYGGGSLLGKALMVLEPGDIARLPNEARPAATATLAMARTSRQIINAAPDPAGAMRAQLQTADDLRLMGFNPVARKTWPAYATANPRDQSTMVGHVARLIIARHPLAYCRLWLRDWEALVIYPNFWPASISRQAAPNSAFPSCAKLNNCYAIRQYGLTLGLLQLASLVVVSVGATLGGLLFILTQMGDVLRRRADAFTIVLFWCAVVLHASLLVSTAIECGFGRYTAPLYVFDVALFFGLLAWTLRAGRIRLRRT